MQKRGFVLLLAMTALSLAAAGYALRSGDRAVSPAARQERLFPGLAPHLADLAWIRLSRGKTTVDFNLVAGRWTVVEKGNYPAAQGKVRQLLLALAELTLIEPKTARPELFARLGLDDPSNGRATLVGLQDRTGKTVAEVVVGKTRHDRLGDGSDAVYVRRPGENRTWLARGSLDLPATIAGWLDRHILDIPVSRIAAVTLTAGDGTALTLRRETTADKFAVLDAPADGKLKGEATLAEPAGALASLTLDDVKPAAELPVPQDGAATAVFTTFDGLTVTLRLVPGGNAPEGAEWVAVKAAGSGAAEPEAAAINTRVGRWTYAVPAARAKLLRTTLHDLLTSEKGS